MNMEAAQKARVAALAGTEFVPRRMAEYALRYRLRPEDVVAHLNGRLTELGEVGRGMMAAGCTTGPAWDVMREAHSAAQAELRMLWQP